MTPRVASSYWRHPNLAAEQATWHRRRALECRDGGHLDQAVKHWDRVDAYNDLLDALSCCRMCGRQLKDPESVARRIGPECAKKSAPEGCGMCGGTLWMSVPDPVLGDYVDARCFCWTQTGSEPMGLRGGSSVAEPVPSGITPTTGS